eukprot:gene12633-13831_t
MLPSLTASIQALSILHYQTVITEDGSNFIDQILKSFGESLLTEAFHYAKASELDEIDFHDIRAASRVLINSGIWNYAVSEGFKGIMKVKDDDEPKQAFPFIDIYNAMKSRDATITVNMEEQFFYNSYLPKIYRINRWIPYYDIDYDFCWEILDVRTGGVILQFDIENQSFWQYENAGKELLTLMKRLKLFRDYLLSLDDKESLKASDLKFDDGRTYEKSQGYESKAMNFRYKAIGRSDLDPFGTEVNIPRIAHPPPVGGGNLVGPNHPMFNPTGQDPNFNQDFNPFFPGNVPQPGYPHYQIPRPRFDPFGPVPGPNSDFDFGNEEYDPRFLPRGPRGPPRGQPRPPNNRFYGEPNPDHFKPPGW